MIYWSTQLKIVLVVFCCLSWPAARAQTVMEAVAEGPLAIGIVFTGGGSFGAFEAGAVQAFFDRWVNDHGVAPPIRVIAGTSTGALIGPFVAMGSDGVKEVADLYQGTKRKDIFEPRAAVFLPFALFSKWSTSVYNSDPLVKLLKERLSDDRLRRIAGLWPDTRVVVLTMDFGTGTPAIYSNAPDEVAGGLARMRDGVLASASTPLTAPPVYIKSVGTQTRQPHVDGGISQVAPFQALFDMAAQSPEVRLTHIVVISPYPFFPGSESAPAQQKRFPAKPNFGEVAARTGALIAESSISKEIALAWAAISLRSAGASVEKVRERTGLNVGRPPIDLTIIAPDTRLGWNTLKFNRAEMQEMFMRGLKAKPRALIP